MKRIIRTLASGVAAVAIVATSLAAGAGPLAPSQAHACSESLSTPSLGITTLSDGRYLYASVNYNCLNSNDYITTVFRANQAPNILHGWYGNPGGSGTNNQYQLLTAYPTGTVWTVWAVDQATGYITPSQHYTM